MRMCTMSYACMHACIYAYIYTHIYINIYIIKKYVIDKLSLTSDLPNIDIV